MQVDGSGRVRLVESVPVLRPDEQVLQKMLEGWRNQQLSRNLQFATIDQRLRMVERFISHRYRTPQRGAVRSGAATRVLSSGEAPESPSG